MGFFVSKAAESDSRAGVPKQTILYINITRELNELEKTPFLEWDDYKDGGSLSNLADLSKVRIQQKADTGGYSAMFRALDKLLDNNLPFYETIYSGIKD